MSNIIDYIKWRGDLSFSESPFNEVDGLIFTQLSFLDFSGIGPSDVNESGSLAEAWNKYFHKGRKPESVILSEEIYEMIKTMADAPRYASLKLSGYTAKIDEAAEKQFAAICIGFGKNTYVFFRGTDDSLVGWKEDFNLAFMESVPAQQEALIYLNNVMKGTLFSPVYVGGHSKGGNLSVYAAMHCKKVYKRRIKKVYAYDSPGFLDNVLETKEYKEVSEKLISIVPEGSVIGQLLGHGKPDDIIVKNESYVLRQHDPFTWEVCGNKFIKVASLNEQSVRINEVISSWLSHLDKSERESFADALYELMTISDAKTLKDILSDKLGFLKALRKISKETKKDINKNIGQIIEQIAKIKGKK